MRKKCAHERGRKDMCILLSIPFNLQGEFDSIDVHKFLLVMNILDNVQSIWGIL